MGGWNGQKNASDQKMQSWSITLQSIQQ